MIIPTLPVGASNFLKQFMKKILLKIIAALVVVWLISCAAIYHVMCQPPEAFAAVMAHVPGPVAFLALPFETLWTRARAGHLKIGDPAPDFTLAKLDKTGSIQLSTLTSARRPAVLIFGSYT
jgi:hypothetical protein